MVPDEVVLFQVRHAQTELQSHAHDRPLFVEALCAAAYSIAVALSLILIGAFLGHKGVIAGNFKKNLGELSVQVTIPALLFTKILYCDQCNSRTPTLTVCKECMPLPQVVSSAWILLFMPLIVVGLGVLLGKAINRLFDCPENFSHGCVAAVAFGNSTGMPIVLLTVLKETLVGAKYGHLGKVDPLLILPIYLLFYPVLQWSIGGWLLGIGEDSGKESAAKEGEKATAVSSWSATWQSANNVLQKVLVPPVQASLLGMFVGATPLHHLFVDIGDQDDDAPLGFLFQGLYALGKAAVPLNLLCLGATLSKGADWTALPLKVGLAITFAKLVLMPAMVLVAIYILSRFVHMEPGMASSVWLVALLVSATPTANNVSTMAELSGQSKEAMATAILLQYLFAPFVLAGSLVCFIGLLAGDSIVGK